MAVYYNYYYLLLKFCQQADDPTNEESQPMRVRVNCRSLQYESLQHARRYKGVDLLKKI